ncbi:hypothetical protein KC19_VG088400 [Ceratodon purpureus]|uniref:Pentapeptide repeat-containing protein n=1 Tax=Ceratodon purpureus TaxID=3225 RepID=A0A8T0HP29_CERPU|nr:hypothetical protein KC19_VG088400 [Ceratodon purpureus]
MDGSTDTFAGFEGGNLKNSSWVRAFADRVVFRGANLQNVGISDVSYAWWSESCCFAGWCAGLSAMNGKCSIGCRKRFDVWKVEGCFGSASKAVGGSRW